MDWNTTEKLRKAKVEAEKEVTSSFKDHYKEDDQMLHRLIDIRWALWT